MDHAPHSHRDYASDGLSERETRSPGRYAGPSDEGRARDWRKAMSDHVAYALLVYTALQIFLTVKALDEGLPSILPYMALVVLVAAIIPACRWFEKRWTGLSDAEARDEGLAREFRRDTLVLWLMAISLPLVLTGLSTIAFAT